MDMNKAKMINDAIVSTVERKAEERGREVGREEEKIEIALNLLKIVLSIKQVADATKLTVEEIENIRTNRI